MYATISLATMALAPGKDKMLGKHDDIIVIISIKKANCKLARLLKNESTTTMLV